MLKMSTTGTNTT